MSKKRKLTSIEGRKGKGTPIEEMIKELPGIIEYQNIYAKTIRARYLALLEEGFTVKQAIELCRTNPFSL